MNFTFFFSLVEGEQKLAARLLSQLDFFYPESQVIIVTDGQVSFFSNFLEKATKIEIIFIEGEHLKKPGTIGYFTTRNFSIISNLSRNKNIVKLDPDSFLKRRFKYIPKEFDWCGDINQNSFCSWCKGGGWLMKKEIINKLLDSNLLLHPKYQYQREFEKERIYEDWRLGSVANSLGIFPAKWSEVFGGGLSISDSRIRKRALVHPVKYINDEQPTP